LPVALGAKELVMVATLIAVGGLLALVSSTLSYRQPVSAGLRS
jgi:hypothetical protein